LPAYLKDRRLKFAWCDKPLGWQSEPIFHAFMRKLFFAHFFEALQPET
jgi:hypothetical protein